MPAIIIENIRSCFNVGNMIRTADALGFDVILSGYTPSPFREEKIKKTSLGAEKFVKISEIWNPKEALIFAKKEYGFLIAAEITDKSLNLKKFALNFDKSNIAIVFGNEVEGVLKETLEFVDQTVSIPMTGKKESLNVGQSSAIFMREIFNHFQK